VREIVRSGEIGNVVGIDHFHCRGAWLAEGNGLWRVDPDLSGGLYFMELCHRVDFMRWVIGEVTHVQSFKRPNVMPQYLKGMPDNVCTILWFECGAIGQIITSHNISAAGPKSDQTEATGHFHYLIVSGDKGAIKLGGESGKMAVTRIAEYPPTSHGARVELARLEERPRTGPGHTGIAVNRLAFIRACAEGRPHHQSAHDAWRSHCVCLAAEQSAREDFQKIAVDYTEPQAQVASAEPAD
jgi:predicted dehydrogenase